ncbi:hypothetical protein PGT21_000110 [Puccinia graminis f. sp. tritici]|uniref:Uncharacterized protein n=1 Tax=Puccinia graminis f. sp. tritici TaxID=56615 RepID=A0A5B0PWK4_PUCGR|nr:hypothetical protein PGT21_000110 [Puccinia graminis f. sp. tritici]
MTSREISILSPQTNPDLHTPWRTLNSFLVDLFCTTKMGLEDSNWYSAMYIWGSVLEVQTISYLVLQDVFEEFKNPGESLSSNGSTAPPTVVNPTATQTWHAIIDQVPFQLRCTTNCEIYTKRTPVQSPTQ